MLVELQNNPRNTVGIVVKVSKAAKPYVTVMDLDKQAVRILQLSRVTKVLQEKVLPYNIKKSE